jgi:UPF0042 nucleotide-binding protein
MQVVLISGLSGSGKSVALNVLEDNGYYCVDNLPVKLLAETVQLLRSAGQQWVAVSIDARGGQSVATLPGYIDGLKSQNIDARLLFLDSKNDTLMRRYAESRRRHPLAAANLTLEESIASERALMAPIAEVGHRIDTSDLHPNVLRSWIKDLLQADRGTTSLLFESFGYKHGVPLDADFVFDVRCLPNPFYEPRLRPLTGRDAAVIGFLEAEPSVAKMLADVGNFVEAWLPAFRNDNRAYLTVAIGCTGGQHRSVYIAERLAARFSAVDGRGPVIVRHRQLAAA